MLDVCAPHGPAMFPAAPAASLAGARVAARLWWRPAAAVRHGVAARASSFVSRIGLDSQNFHTRDLSQLLWVGPVPGDIAEIEAYCRIFRAAEQLHTAVMSALCDPETGECPVRYDVESEDLPVLEDKVAAMLGCMLALLNRGRNEVLSGRSGVASAFQGSEDSTSDRIPPLALFRGDMKRCCESMQVALASYLAPSEPRGVDVWRKLQRLKNACYDAGFPRADGSPCPTLFANWFPVYYSTASDDSGTEELEVAFWRGGKVSEEGLAWLLEKGFKTIVDLREEDVKDDLYLSAVQEAVSCGKIEVVNLPVEIGTAPSAEQFEGFKQDLRAVIHGNNTLGVYITLRMRLRCEIFRNGKAMPGKVFDVLNEVVVDRGSNPYLSKIECYEHNHLITKVQGDGVIVATPTGSTAYSTAAGGSMVDSAHLELKIPDDARSNAWVSFDGKRRQQLSRGDSVHISMSQHPLPTVNKSDQTGDWFRSLIRCLNWNERLDQKAL
nr:unnamed protein product [Digitaria exilis]